MFLLLGLLVPACTGTADSAADGGPRSVTTATCNYHGTLYDDGAVFPAGDGCNSCKCNPLGTMPGQWGCSLIACAGFPAPDAAPPDRPAAEAFVAPDKQRPDDGPFPDFHRPEHPGGFCPIDPPQPGSACTLEANQGCGYSPICATGTPVSLHCACSGGRWSCDQGGYCKPP